MRAALFVHRYYDRVLRRDTSTVLSSGNSSAAVGVGAEVRTLVMNFTDMSNAPNYMQLHIVERPPSDTHGALTVAELEATMNAVHAATLVSDVCGWDQWMEFHFGVSTYDWRPLDEVLPQIEALGYKCVAWCRPEPSSLRTQRRSFERRRWIVHVPRRCTPHASAGTTRAR